MNGYDARRVLETAIDKLNNPKGWLIVGGSVVGLVMLSRRGVLTMNGYDQRRTLERLINKVGDGN